MFSFEDRVSAYPNRYLLTNENGGTSYVVLERADEPIVAGTPLNAETFNEVLGAIPVADATATTSYYRMVDGAVEWINPPMQPGVEYRTAERWNGKPVYRKLVAYTTSTTIGNVNECTKISIPHGISGLTGVVWCRATTAWGAILPFVAEGGGVTAVNSVESSVINLRIVFDTWNPATFYFDLAYVKN